MTSQPPRPPGQTRSPSIAAARRLDPISLRLFRAAVEERSLAQAAERESIALSAASRRIAEMEARLGTTLLRRHDRGVAPTAAGTPTRPPSAACSSPTRTCRTGCATGRR